MTDRKKIIAIILSIEIIGVALFLYDFITAKINFDGVIDRPMTGEGIVKEDLEVSFGENDEYISIDVNERAKSRAEIEELFAEAEKEIDETFKGKNNSYDEVAWDVDVRDSYVGGKVSAEWTFSDYEQLSGAGQVTYKNGGIVYANALLTCYGEVENYEFPFRVVEPDPGTKEGFLYYIQKEVRKAEHTSLRKSSFRLPEKVRDEELIWKRKSSYRGLILMALGAATGAAMAFGLREEDRRKDKARKEELSKDYPKIVNDLSLYVSAGISLREAMLRVYKQYEKSGRSKEKRPGFEVIGKVCHEIHDGKSEMIAYEGMGTETDHRSYRKLAMLLTQNLKKGTAGLSGALEQEAREAFEERKVRARIAGEQASTKLLLPMMMQLGIVIVILVIPALLTMGL